MKAKNIKKYQRSGKPVMAYYPYTDKFYKSVIVSVDYETKTVACVKWINSECTTCNFNEIKKVKK